MLAIPPAGWVPYAAYRRVNTSPENGRSFCVRQMKELEEAVCSPLWPPFIVRDRPLYANRLKRAAVSTSNACWASARRRPKLPVCLHALGIRCRWQLCGKHDGVVQSSGECRPKDLHLDDNRRQHRCETAWCLSAPAGLDSDAPVEQSRSRPGEHRSPRKLIRPLSRRIRPAGQPPDVRSQDGPRRSRRQGANRVEEHRAGSHRPRASAVRYRVRGIRRAMGRAPRPRDERARLGAGYGRAWPAYRMN